jgi:hypothetical protein
MTRRYSRRAEKRAKAYAREAAQEFDSALVHNRVSETVDGQHTRDNHLLRLLDLAERAYQLSDDAAVASLDSAAFDAAETLNAEVEDAVERLVAEACLVVRDETDDWTDVYDESDLSEARAEAREWLAAHPAAAEAAGADLAEGSA